jgi:hypothetical protein
MGLAKRFETVTNPAEQTRLAMKLLGRSGAELIPFLKRGADGIAAFRKEAQELGVVFGDEALKQADDFGREMVRVKFALEGLRNTFAVPFLGAFVEGVRLLVKGLKAARPTIFQISDAFRDAGTRMGGMLDIMRRGIQLFSDWFSDTTVGRILAQMKGFKALEAVLIGLGVVFVAVAAQALGAWLVAAGPFILLAALIGLIVDDIYNFIKGNDSLIGRIERWANAIGDPDEHPITKFLRTGVALLMDLTDPAHWARFAKAAAGAAAHVTDSIRGALGLRKLSDTKTERPADPGIHLPEWMKGGKLDESLETGGIFNRGGLLDHFGFSRGGYEQMLNKGTIVPQTGAAGGAAGRAQITNYVTVDASGMTPEQGQNMVEKAIDNAMYKFTSTAFPATSGGEN